MTADGKYSRLVRDNLTQRIQIQLSQKKKTFSQFFSLFLKSSLNLEHFRKKDDTHSWCIYEITDSQKHAITMPKKSRFRVSIEKEHGKCARISLTFEVQILYDIYWSLGKQLSYKKSLLVICKISKLFPNTLTADGKYSLPDRDNLTQRIQIQLSQKQKTLS